MLIRFNVKNFLSFADRTDSKTKLSVSEEFSMLAGTVRSKPDHVYNSTPKLLKFAAVYGANAAGKSNLVKAINFMKEFIKNGLLPAGASEQYCKIDAENKTKPSYFELEILLNNKCYAYGFEIVLSTGVIVSEWLYELSKIKEISLLEKTDKGSYKFSGMLKNISELDVFAKAFEGNGSLFLSAMNRTMAGFYNKNISSKILKQVFDWIVNDLDINFPDKPLSDVSFFHNSASINEFSHLLKAFGTGISEITMNPSNLDKLFASIPFFVKKDLLQQIEFVKKLKSTNKNESKWSSLVRNRNDIFILNMDNDNELIVNEMLFKHDFEKNDILFTRSEESDGTARLFDLIEVLVSNKNKTYIIDELDRCLHPCLSYEFVKTFFEYAKSKNIQLIVTTHESRLMDFDLLRRDEIWFVNKRATGQSDMYSLEEYNERFDKKIDKAYLDGRYKGVPLFTSVFPVKKDCE